MRRRILTAAICVLVILAGAASPSSPADGSSPEAYQERQRALIEEYLRDPYWRTVYDSDLGVLPPEGTIPSFRNTAYLALMMLELPELVRELGYDPVLEVSKMIERMIASQWTTPDEDITAYPRLRSPRPETSSRSPFDQRLPRVPYLVALDLAQDIPLERYPGGVDGAAGKPILRADNVSVDDGVLTVNGRSIVLDVLLSADDGKGHESDYGL